MKKIFTLAVSSCFLLAGSLSAQTVKLNLDLTKPGVNVSPQLYGLMTEEINHSYDGGLYAELIRNRIFKDNPQAADGWSVLTDGGGKGSIQLDERQIINDALTVSLKLTVDNSSGRVGIANEGYWGIPVKAQTTYKASFYAKGSDGTEGPLTVSIESNDGRTKYATAQVNLVKGSWQKYQVQLTTGNVQPTMQAHFVISANRAGNYWFNLVSLFPPTYNNRPNGNRIDIMNLMAEMKPTFLRFPGGNFLEGDYFSSRFPWKETLGPLEQRPGHPGCWQYRASDGMGLLEFLEWCEDLKIEPLLAVYAGYSLKKDYIPAGPLLKPLVEDALDEIEYVTGGVNTYWGAKRAKDGHPQPFKLKYIEVGNEDWFDRSGSYDGRFTQFYDAIKAKYPQLQCISTIDENRAGHVTSRKVEMVDEHYYRTAWQMEEDAAHYDKYNRKTSPKIFVGEWATREGRPTTNMNAALGDAAWMTGMERNSDIVLRSCYAPLFVNVNPKTATAPAGMQWPSDLIGFNALSSFGSPSYYAQKMFNTYIGNKVVPVTGENIPTQTRAATRRDSTAGVMPKPIPAMFYVATRDTKTGALYLKVVNTTGTSQSVNIALNGAAYIASEGSIVVLKGDKPEDTNTIDEPKKIIPVTSKINGLGKNFTHVFAPYSVTILQLQAKLLAKK